MLVGLDQLFDARFAALRRRLRDARVGVLTHGAALDRAGRGTLTVLEQLGAAPVVVFGPEHGLLGVAQAEEPVSGETALATAGREVEAEEGASPGSAPRVVSLYGSSKESLTPRPEDLSDLDVLLVDLVDVGTRYYTYVWTALLATRAAAAAGVHVVLLDRPNPLSGNPELTEGLPQDPGYLSFVGLEPLPIRHGLTLAEVVTTFAARDGLPLGRDGAVSVVPTRGWERYRSAAAWGRPFIPPSPNLPTLDAALVYPGGCLVEGTELSEGRGTTTPFQVVGAPWLDGARLAEQLLAGGVVGALVRPVSFRPTFEKHAGKVCHGVMIHPTDFHTFRPVSVYLRLLALARAQAPERFRWRTRPYEFETERLAFDLLTGSSLARERLEAGASPESVAEAVAGAPPGWAEAVHEAEARALTALA